MTSFFTFLTHAALASGLVADGQWDLAVGAIHIPIEIKNTPDCGPVVSIEYRDSQGAHFTSKQVVDPSENSDGFLWLHYFEFEGKIYSGKLFGSGDEFTGTLTDNNNKTHNAILKFQSQNNDIDLSLVDIQFNSVPQAFDNKTLFVDPIQKQIPGVLIESPRLKDSFYCYQFHSQILDQPMSVSYSFDLRSIKNEPIRGPMPFTDLMGYYWFLSAQATELYETPSRSSFALTNRADGMSIVVQKRGRLQ